MSHGWRGILHGRDLLITHLGKAIGNGETTSLWSDSWICPERNIKPFGPITEKEQDLMVSDILTRKSREWNQEKIDNLLPELSSLILALRPSVLGAHDSFIWPLQKSGNYTAKLGYYSIQNLKNQSTQRLLGENTCNWKKLIWTPTMSPKLMFFLWKVGNNALPTGENLQKRGLLINTTCARCGEVESISHILFLRRYAKDVWSIGPWTNCLEPSPQASFFEILQTALSLIPLPPYGFVGNTFPWICWTLWTSRNLLVFENRTQSPLDTLNKAILALKEWETAQPIKTTTTKQPPLLRQDQPLSHQELFCNTDASWKAEGKVAGMAWIITDRASTELFRGLSFQRHVSSPCMGEALAIRKALLHAASLNLLHICIRTDSQELARAIQSRRRSTELYGVLSDIRFSFLPHLSVFFLSFCVHTLYL